MGYTELKRHNTSQDCDLCMRHPTDKYLTVEVDLTPGIHCVREKEHFTVDIFICQYCQAQETKRQHRRKKERQTNTTEGES